MTFSIFVMTLSQLKYPFTTHIHYKTWSPSTGYSKVVGSALKEENAHSQLYLQIEKKTTKKVQDVV